MSVEAKAELLSLLEEAARRRERAALGVCQRCGATFRSNESTINPAGGPGHVIVTVLSTCTNGHVEQMDVVERDFGSAA